VLSRRFFHVLLLVLIGVAAFVCVIVFLTSGSGKDRLVFSTAAPLGMFFASGALFTWAVVAGASFIGAEWGTGSMATLLTWEPRRGRVLVAKLIAMAATAAVAAMVVLLLVVVFLIPSGVVHGTMANLDGSWWLGMLGSWWRGGALAAMGAGLGLGLGGVLRNSAGAIAIWLVFQYLISQLLTLWKPGWFRWLPEGNIRFFVAPPSGFSDALQRFLPYASVLRGGLTLLAYAAAAMAAGYAVFRARDVT
jgi:ABC-2 type transport system permease protein